MQIYEHISISTNFLWKFSRLVRVTDYVLGLNTSGLYHWRYVSLRELSEATGASVDTLKRDLAFFHRAGLVYYRDGYLKLVKLKGRFEKLRRLYRTWKKEIEGSENPKQFFVNIYQRDRIGKNVSYQIIKEAKKCNDKKNKKKIMSLVRLSREQEFGRKQGVNVSYSSIGGIFDMSRATGARIVKKLKESGLMTVKRNSEAVAPFTPDKYKELKRGIVIRGGKEFLYGCYLYVKDSTIYERKSNSYVFNW